MFLLFWREKQTLQGNVKIKQEALKPKRWRKGKQDAEKKCHSALHLDMTGCHDLPVSHSVEWKLEVSCCADAAPVINL